MEAPLHHMVIGSEILDGYLLKYGITKWPKKTSTHNGTMILII